MKITSISQWSGSGATTNIETIDDRLVREAMAQPPGRNKTAAANCRGRVVALVQSLPGARMIPTGVRHLSLEVRGKRFGWFLDDHHGDGRLALNLKAAPGVNQSLSNTAPEHFHIPKYVGHRGWLGIWLDSPPPDWSEIEKLLTGAYRLTAPKRLLKQEVLGPKEQ